MAETYSFTRDNLTRDGQPWFPIMGEFHYSRYPQQYWKESIYKMKAGGVDVISTYVFWLHHEEIEGEYDFTGQRDLRRFTETVKECGMKMFLRIGPWCHGEARNGGFPDWLLKKEYEPRSNDERYFAEVRKFYAEIFSHVSGLFHQDGGPIIGIQIENEYGHCGGLNGEAGEEHMRRLTQIAKEVGLIAPLYTATGWGGAVTGGLLPVMGGYCEAPWDQSLTELEPNENYIFTNDRNDPNIGSDYGKTHNITYDITAFPYLTAELGGGLQVTHHRRPVASAKDIGAMSLVKLGSGVSLLGYYMYHGGTNPEGKLSTLQESRATGYLNDLPVYSYDFAAPVREFGQMSDTLNEIKLLAMFLKDFGSELCEMPTYLEVEQKPEDFETLRTAVRRNGRQGYLFVNNYQRRHAMKEHLGEVLEVSLCTNERQAEGAEGEIREISTEQERAGVTGENSAEICGDSCVVFPAMDILDGDYFFFPFNMPIGDGILKFALATPLCRMNCDGKEIVVFYTDVDPQYDWEKEPTNAKVLTISREMALNAWKVELDHTYLLITENKVIESEAGYEILMRKNSDLRSYPVLPETPQGYCYAGMDGEFALYQRVEESPKVNAEWQLVCEEEGRKFYEVELNYPEWERSREESDDSERNHIAAEENGAGRWNDCFLQIDFAGDQAKLYVDGKFVDDWFYTGKTWEIGMKRFGFPKKVEIEVDALRETDERFLETWPEFQDGIACRIESVRAEAEWTVKICK